MKKLFILFSVLSVLYVPAYTFELKPELLPAANEYVLVVNSYDWGPAADKIIINTGRTFIAEAVKADEFTVDITVPLSKKDEDSYGVVKGHRTITAAYLCDEHGSKTAEKGPYISLELSVRPDDSSCNPFKSIPVIQEKDKAYDLRIKNKTLDLLITKCTGLQSMPAALFHLGQFNSNKITMSYACWEPESHAEGTPLIVWLHGISGGGQDPYVPILDAKAVSLISPQIQQYFTNGASVLIPQCPSGWFETTTKGAFGMHVWEPVDVNGTVEKITKPVSAFLGKVFSFAKSDKKETQPDAAVSYYTGALKELIDSYTALRPYIDKKRIYIAGYSAGGYMVMNMCIQYPGYFAAAVPVCEAYLNSKITNDQIEFLAKQPFWFVYAKNDGTIKPEANSIPTITRLHNAGAENLHSSVFDDVHDTSGLYKIESDDDDDDDDEKESKEKLPFQYPGHFSWTYVLNDQCRENDVSLFAWLAEQHLP